MYASTPKRNVIVLDTINLEQLAMLENDQTCGNILLSLY